MQESLYTLRNVYLLLCSYVHCVRVTHVCPVNKRTRSNNSARTIGSHSHFLIIRITVYRVNIYMYVCLYVYICIYILTSTFREHDYKLASRVTRARTYAHLLRAVRARVHVKMFVFFLGCAIKSEMRYVKIFPDLKEFRN